MKKRITLSPGLARQLEEREDLDDFVSSIVATYLEGGFIRKSDIAGMVTLGKVYRKVDFTGVETYDTVTREFKGITVEGRRVGSSIFIPSERLHDLVEENQVLLVVKSRRSRGISQEEDDGVFVGVPRDEMV